MIITKERRTNIRPDFFIVGAPKCGTTAMYIYLKEHPEIFMSEEKELHYFGSDLKSHWFQRDLDKYLSHFSEGNGMKRVGEASVWYLYSKKAAKEIKDFSPSSRIIIMLRNPIDMMYSNYYQFLYNGNENLPSFKEAIEAEEDRKCGKSVPETVHFAEGLFYSDTARFSQQVQRYFDVFNRERVHVIIYDDFKSDTAKVYGETLEFLEVDPSFLPNFKIINPNKLVRIKTLRNLIVKPPGWYTTAGRILLPDSLREYMVHLLKGFNKQFNTSFEVRPPMDPELRRRLRKRFEPEVEQLSSLLGRDLTHWCKD